MTSEKPESDRLDSDLEAIKGKFGPLAEVYAENRSEAAARAGNAEGEDHWKNVADRAEGDDQ